MEISSPFQQFVDTLPIAGIFVLFTGAALLATECGYHLGSWWQRRTQEEKEGPTPILARRTPESDVLSLYIDSLNEVIDLHQKRVTANLYGRVPETILLLLLIGPLLTLAMVVYNAGLNHKRSRFTSIVQILVLSAVITLVFDLDRPRDGFLEVSLQPLIDLQHMIEPEADATPR